MGRTRFSKKESEWSDLSAEDLFEALSRFFLDSGFGDFSSARTIDDLRRALSRLLASQAIVPLEELERSLEGRGEPNSPAGRMIDELLGRLISAGYVSIPALDRGAGGAAGDARFDLTDKGVDFLGLKSLREVLGRAGRSAIGRHPTTQLSTGVESYEAPREYEFGDSLNLDPAATILAAVRRAGTSLPLPIEEGDLRVRQTEHRVAAATVILLDCSHSMILYGEDRFTPAKRVALALSHLIRTQYPGDELRMVLFHDSAEEVPVARLPRVQVGPYHTNTAAGLALARKVLARSRREIRQIVMITDGKPSALTLPDGRIYKNSFGLDPMILDATFRQVLACRRAGITINTFMLARDPALVDFVREVSRICRGRAYFTTPLDLGQYVTLDFLSNKLRTVH